MVRYILDKTRATGKGRMKCEMNLPENYLVPLESLPYLDTYLTGT